MTQQHLITPPPKLVVQWQEEPAFSALSPCAMVTVTNTKIQDIATRAAQWGADQELEACCEVLQDWRYCRVDDLRAIRRPKPPSLKQQALAELAEWENICNIAPDSPIRRALEQLDD
jgi:hypothetical protein